MKRDPALAVMWGLARPSFSALLPTCPTVIAVQRGSLRGDFDHILPVRRLAELRHLQQIVRIDIGSEAETVDEDIDADLHRLQPVLGPIAEPGQSEIDDRAGVRSGHDEG